MPINTNQSNCSNNNVPGLPPVRRARPSSSTEKGSWGKVLTCQRKMSLDNPNQLQEQLVKTPIRSTTGQSRKNEKEKCCPRLNRTFRGESYAANETIMEANSKFRDKQSDLVRIMSNTFPFPGDDPLILEGAMMLEKFEQNIESIEAQQISWITMVDCKLKLQRLLLEKVKSIAEEDCITLIEEGRSYVRQIETIYTEDQYKLETACNLTNLPEKDRKVALEDFMMTSKKRKGLPNETQRRFKSWISDLNNCHRLLNINYRVPKERLTVLMVKQTAIKLEKIKMTILRWLSLTLTTNIKIMAIYWDHLPFETLNDVFVACLTFNQIWPAEPIDPVTILSLTQAEAASTRISFLIQSEAKKITSAKRAADRLNTNKNTNDKTKDQPVAMTGAKLSSTKDNKAQSLPNSPPLSHQSSIPRHITNQLIKDGAESTSDYCTNSPTSSSSNNDKGYIISTSGESIDLVSYLSIVSSSSQRIVLKLSFILQNTSNGSSSSFFSTPSTHKSTVKPRPQHGPLATKKVTSARATWSKVTFSSASNGNHDHANNSLTSSCHNCYDNLYWPVFWKNFTRQLLDDIMFAQSDLLTGFLSSPIFFTPKSFQRLVHESLENCLKENDFPSEAIVEIRKISNLLNYHLIDQSWFKVYLDIYHINSDRRNQVFGRNEDISYVPKAVDVIEALISIVQREDDYAALQVQKVCSIKQIDSLLRLMINHTNNLSNKKPIKDLITFYKQIQVLEKSVKSLNFFIKQSLTDHNEILGLHNNIIETLESKIITGLQKSALQTFAYRINQQKSKSNTSNSQGETIIPYVKNLILEPNLQLLTDCSSSHHIIRLKCSMIALFAKIIYQIFVNDGVNGQLRLTRHLKASMKGEIADFIRDYDGWFKSNHQQLNEINDLRQLIDESSKSNECSLFKRLNRIHPISVNSSWIESQSVNNLADLRRCGCFF